MERWQGKVALVTGASAGIGAAIASALVKAGVTVVGVGRNLSRFATLLNDVKDYDGQLHPIEGDVTKLEDVTRILQTVKDKFEKVHILVNNAGLATHGPFIDNDINAMHTVIDTNIKGAINITQKVLQLMRDTDVTDGHIIFMNSVLGHIVVDLKIPFNVYPATQYAISALTESLRQELAAAGSLIKITNISPGAVDTTQTRHQPNVTEDVRKHMQTMGKLHPDDVARAVVFVLSSPSTVQIHDIVFRALGSA